MVHQSLRRSNSSCVQRGYIRSDSTSTAESRVFPTYVRLDPLYGGCTYKRRRATRLNRRHGMNMSVCSTLFKIGCALLLPLAAVHAQANEVIPTDCTQSSLVGYSYQVRFELLLSHVCKALRYLERTLFSCTLFISRGHFLGFTCARQSQQCGIGSSSPNWHSLQA